jgi:predicted component of type VI protein secretion system
MPTLIIEHQGRLQAGTLGGRVLIGRWPDNAISINDRAVSRIHAWIGLQQGQYYIADAGSRTGTFVNGQPLHERHLLNDGDEIRIGPGIIRYSEISELPADAVQIDLTPRTPDELSGDHGIFLDCVCGAPLWLPREFTGVGQCRYCGHTVTQGMENVAPPLPPEPDPIMTPPPVMASETIAQSAAVAMKPQENDDDDFDAVINEALTKAKAPVPPARRVPPPAPIARPTSRGPGPVVPSAVPARHAPPVVPPQMKPIAPPAAPLPAALPPRKIEPPTRAQEEQVCGICHAPITVFDETMTCPSCGLGFHAECWHENHGCSAYGCPQVNAAG